VLLGGGGWFIKNRMSRHSKRASRVPMAVHCIDCGAEVPAGAQFCPVCGSSVIRPGDTGIDAS